MKRLIFIILSLCFLFCSCNDGVKTQTDGGPSNTQDSKTEWEERKVLVAYYSGTGNTERIAKYIQAETGGSIFKIEPVQEYTTADLNYNNSSSRVSIEHNGTNGEGNQQDVELKQNFPDDFADYDTIFIGVPIWWGLEAWPINRFLKNNNFSGKNVIVFSTSASSGIGNIVASMKEKAGDKGSWQGRRFSSSESEANVEAWLKELEI